MEFHEGSEGNISEEFVNLCNLSLCSKIEGTNICATSKKNE